MRPFRKFTFELSGSVPNAGAYVASAGDVNADGYADVVNGSSYTGSNGAVDLFSGSAAGIGTRPTQTLASPASGCTFGHGTSGAGDVNGDGYDDVIVGAPLYASYTGRAWVYLGYADNDADGYEGTVDCDDDDASIHP